MQAPRTSTHSVNSVTGSSVWANVEIAVVAASMRRNWSPKKTVYSADGLRKQKHHKDNGQTEDTMAKSGAIVLQPLAGFSSPSRKHQYDISQADPRK